MTVVRLAKYQAEHIAGHLLLYKYNVYYFWGCKMIEKIRISLWDVFTFFMTGVFTVIAALLFFKMNGSIPKVNSIFEILIKIPATYIIVVMPILLILFGIYKRKVLRRFKYENRKAIFSM
jgi:hypothetical protein